MKYVWCAIGLMAFVCGCGPKDAGDDSGDRTSGDGDTTVAAGETPGGEEDGSEKGEAEASSEEAPDDEPLDMNTEMGDDVEPAEESDLTALMAEAESAEAKETEKGRKVADRELGWKLIEYGQREDHPSPEAIILGVQILHRNPVESKTEDGEGGEKEELITMVEEAADMRPDDETLLVMAENVLDALDESSRGLAGGPQQWIITVDRGKYYQLDPRLVYNAQEAAIITAYAEDPKAMLGATVRRYDQRKIMKRTAGRGKVRIEWNSGIFTTGWDCRIYNMTGPDGMKLRVETN